MLMDLEFLMEKSLHGSHYQNHTRQVSTMIERCDFYSDDEYQAALDWEEEMDRYEQAMLEEQAGEQE